MIIGISGKKQHGKNTIAKIIEYITDQYKQHKQIVNSFNQYLKVIAGSYQPHWEEKQFAGKLKEIVCLLIGCTIQQLEDNSFKEKELGEEWRIWYWTHYKWAMGANTVGKISSTYTSEEEARKCIDRLGVPIKEAMPGAILQSEILTPRKLLQLVGTDCGRNIIHPNIWVNALMADYKPVWNDPEAIEDNDYSIVRMQSISSEISLIHYNGGASEAEVYNDEIVQPNWIITDVRFPNEAEAIKDKGGIVIRVQRDWMESNDTHESETSLDNYTGFDYIIHNNNKTPDSLIHFVKQMLKNEKLI